MKNRFILIIASALIIFTIRILPSPEPAYAADEENYTYKLAESTTSFQFWTTPPSERVFKGDDTPSDTGSGVKVYAAANEFEPFQVVVKPAASGPVAVNIGDFGSGVQVEIYQVKYT